MIKNRFNSIKEWKNYCFNTHSLYLENTHFKKWINKKDIHIFNFSSLKNDGIKSIALGMEDAVKTAKLHFKIKNFEKIDFIPSQESLWETLLASVDRNEQKFYLKTFVSEYIAKNRFFQSSQILRMAVEQRKHSHKDHASVFIFSKPIKSLNSIIKDGEALTYVSEGIIFFTFEPSINYPGKFLRCRAKHETLHLLGLNFHHEDINVKGYKHDVKCNMDYNAPTQHLCRKCRDGLLSFWEGIRQATDKNV